MLHFPPLARKNAAVYDKYMKEKLRLLKHPFVILAFGILLMVILLIVYFNISGSQQSQKVNRDQNIQMPTLYPEVTNKPPEEINDTQKSNDSSQIIKENFPRDDYYGDYDASGLENVQKVEDLAEGTKKYTATSSNPSRSNIIITKDNKTIYQRSIPEKGADIPLQNFIELYGQAEKVISGPDFYGKDQTDEYIYAQKGIAVVVNKQSKQVIEQHFFKPTSVEDYITKYNNDRF